MSEDKIISMEESARRESERLKRIELKLKGEVAGWMAMREKNYEGGASQSGNNGARNKKERREPIVIIKSRKNLEDK